MDEIKEMIVNLKMESRILTTLIDTILEACDLDFTGEDLSIRSDSKILTVVKTFYPDEYDNCLTDLKDKAKKLEEEK